MKGPTDRSTEHLLVDDYRSGNGPRYILGFPCHDSWKFLEQFQIVSSLKLVSSEGNRPVLIERL